MWHAIFLVEINPERTVTPQSHALSISGLTAAIKTPTLRKTIKVMRKNRKSRRRWIKLNLKKTTLPAQHHTCSHPVCGHYEDTKREILLKQFFNFFSTFFNILERSCSSQGFFTWLESPVQVSGMSHSFTASRHVIPRSSYCQRHRQCGMQIKQMKQSPRTVLTMSHNQWNNSPCSPCSTARCCTWHCG